MSNRFLSFIPGISVMGAGLFPLCAAAEFLADSKGALDSKNYYFNRDYRENAGQSKRAEWAQGFTLRIESGFTEGALGFGVDTVGMLGLKLDSSPENSGTGLLSRESKVEPGHPNYARRAHDEYSKLGVTGKVRVSKTSLQVGYMVPDMPTLQPNTSRLFPMSFTGTALTSSDVKNLTFNAGQLDRVTQRDSTDAQKMALSSQYGAYRTAMSSDAFRYAGADYQLTSNTVLTYQFGQLERIYKQHFMGVKNSFKWGVGTFKTDIRYSDSSEDGAGLAGKVDNRSLSTRIGYSVFGHSLSGGYQEQYGSTPYAYVDGTNSYLFSEYQLSNFSQTGERVWHARYDFDCAAVGAPGLIFSTRYAKGDNATVTRLSGEGREWERDFSIGYVVQNGPLKNASLKWQNASATSNFTRDTNENRVILGYTVSLW